MWRSPRGGGFQLLRSSLRKLGNGLMELQRRSKPTEWHGFQSSQHLRQTLRADPKLPSPPISACIGQGKISPLLRRSACRRGEFVVSIAGQHGRIPLSVAVPKKDQLLVGVTKLDRQSGGDVGFIEYFLIELIYRTPFARLTYLPRRFDPNRLRL
jgi:hypothetical protein